MFFESPKSLKQNSISIRLARGSKRGQFNKRLGRSRLYLPGKVYIYIDRCGLAIYKINLREPKVYLHLEPEGGSPRDLNVINGKSYTGLWFIDLSWEI